MVSSFSGTAQKDNQSDLSNELTVRPNITCFSKLIRRLTIPGVSQKPYLFNYLAVDEMVIRERIFIRLFRFSSSNL